MKINMRSIHLFIAGLLSVCIVQGQEFDPVKNITPAAPEASQFQKYGDIPVSYYTGTPSISIPIYTVQSFDVTVPIGLSYHASGVKLTEMASWVGTGWSLSAGGMLSRSVRGKPDFIDYVDDQVTQSYFNTTTSYPTIPSSLNLNDYGYVVDAVNQEVDVQPDEYYINFLGRSVKFYIKQSKEIIVDPSDKIKIDYPTQTSPYWVVTDASGTQYTFGSTVESREISKHTNPGNTTTDFVSSWYLVEIRSATDHAVTFDYELAGGFTHLPNQRYHNGETMISGSFSPTWLCPTDPSGWDAGEGKIIRRPGGVPYAFKPVKLSQINFDRGGESHSVEFVANNARNDAEDDVENVFLEYYKLNFINIRQGANKRLSYVFNYDNLSNGLWLTSLNNVSYDYGGFEGKIEETYRFEYDDHTTLPDQKSWDMDYWGLFNGAGNTIQTLLPAVNGYNGANRAYNFTYAKKGTLTKIIYPTGGFSAFEYEPHEIAPNFEAGGLRVKKITSGAVDGPDSPDTDLVREFIYKAPGESLSSGNRAAPFGNNYSTTFYHGCTITGQIDTLNSSQNPNVPDEELRYVYDNMTTHSSHSVNGGGFMSIGYSNVQELIGEGGSNGRKLYEYTHVSSPFHEDGFPPQGYQGLFSPIYFNSLANGRLKRQVTQRRIANNGNESDYETLSEIINTWETEVNSNDYIQGLVVSLAVDGNSVNNFGEALDVIEPIGEEFTFLDVVAYLPYRIKPDWIKLTRTVTNNFEGGTTAMTDTTDYTKSGLSDRWFKDFTISQKLTYGVSGIEETTTMSYPFNGPATTVNSILKDKYIIPVLSSTTTRPVPNSADRVMGGGKTTYTIETLTNTSVPLPNQQFQITQGIIDLGATGDGGEEVLQGKFNKYNGDGLPTEIEDALGHKTSLKWHHDLLLASCANATEDEFFFEGFEYTGGGVIGNAHTGRHYKSGTYDILFTTTNDRVYKVSYWYLSSDVWYYKEEVFENGMQLDEGTAIDDVRVYPADAQMSTYTYDTFFGLTSQSGPDNRPVYYIYDAAGRLKLLKDQDGKIVQAYDHKFLTSDSY